MPPLYETAIGIDLAAIGNSGTACAKVHRVEGEVEATILRPTPLLTSQDYASDFVPAITPDMARICRWINQGIGIVLDCPIDLQGLPCVSSPRFLWQVALRPVDRLFGAKPPLADTLGWVVGRCLQTLRLAGLMDYLGSAIFETYPKATLNEKGCEVVVKGWSVMLHENRWQITAPVRGDEANTRLNGYVSWLVDSLHLYAPEPLNLHDHDLDAVICGLPLISPCPLLSSEIRDRLRITFPDCTFDPPNGYALDGGAIWWKRLSIRGAVQEAPVAPPVAGAHGACNDPGCALNQFPLEEKRCPNCHMLLPNQGNWAGIDAHFYYHCDQRPVNQTYQAFKALICQQHWPR